VVDEPVDHRGGGHVVSEDLTPGAERLVRRDDHRCSFVAAGDEAEHEVRGFGIKRDVADLVDDDQRDERQASQFGFEVALAFLVRQPGDPFGGGRELDALAGEACADRDRDRQVRLAGARRLGVELLMSWMSCRAGCGLWRRLAICVMWSCRFLGGGLSVVRLFWSACWLMGARGRCLRAGRICRFGLRRGCRSARWRVLGLGGCSASGLRR
jgi:hypothetical protein